MPFRTIPTFFLFFVLPSILYAGLVTQFSFDFFTYDYLWKAYNSLALSILDGRLDIPYEAIGRESLYYDGKVYMYYGSLPVLFRLLASPFVDLNTLPLAKLFVWITTTTGAASLQYAILKYSSPKNTHFDWDLTAKVKIILLSLTVWFGGAHIIIVQKGMMYHEVYAAMLMLSSFFIVLIWRDIFWDYPSRKYRLITYACIAALALHTRQTVGIALYLATIMLLCLSTFDNENNRHQANSNWRLILSSAINNSFFPLLILFAGGAILFLLNHLRFDDIFSMTRGQYGFHKLGEVATPRVCGREITGASRFDLYRVLPNLMYYLVGGGYTHSKIINWIGIGYVRKELTDTFLLIFLWPSLILAFFYSFIATVKRLKNNNSFKEKAILLLLTIFSLSAILTLSYTTITIRYAADLWLPLGFMLLIFSNIWLIQDTGKNHRRKKVFFLLFLLCTSVNVAYNAHLYHEYKKWTLLEDTINGQPTPTTLEKLYKPVQPEIDIQSECSKYNFNSEIWHKRLFK